ncbi:MAG: hypothetical protein QGF74_02655 [Candidatus Nanoarchaeia archaeon]|jgi:UDPglucose 6-dehydrogenase|nr:hypothetical protein [Candidatus Nanoarchaeia archaeon]|tara:strand:+ start:19748 stop:20605 length:858 start_codon:yes stop_codon:yes gene_type:complete
MKVGIIGVGFVGGATKHVLDKAHNVFPYDKFKSPYNTSRHLEVIAKEARATFICVPTPMKESGEIDYSPIHNSLQSLQDKVEEIERDPSGLLVVIKSTAVSGSTDKLDKEYPFKFAVNPEFLREKTAIDDMENTNRVVLGVEDKWSEDLLMEIYKPVFPNAHYSIVNRKTAEMIKYAANVTLTGQIMVANVICKICEEQGIDYSTLRKEILLDERIGTNTEVPGPDGDYGVGGKCFPKDLLASTFLAKELNISVELLEAIWNTNLLFRKNRDWLDIKGATSENPY